MKGRRFTAAVALVALLTVVGCEEMTVPDETDSARFMAPPSIIGSVVAFTIVDGSDCAAIGEIYRLWFVDANTIRGVRDDSSFSQHTESWNWQRAGSGVGELEVVFADTTDRWQLRFSTSTASGDFTYIAHARRAGSDSCGEYFEAGEVFAYSSGTFELVAPPSP